MENLVIIDPKEYGLEEKKASEIEKSFLPKQIETNSFIEQYNNIVNSELTHDLIKPAQELRRKLVKVRTGIAEIHKAEKAFFLASGKYVDALKNKLTLPVEQMEEQLSNIETYFEKLEEKRKAQLKAEKKRIEDQRIENERLKKEADEREKELAIERKKLANEQAKKDADAKKENDRLAKISADEKAKADQLAKEKADREAKELEAKQAEEKRLRDLANAGDKAKFRDFYDTFKGVAFPELDNKEISDAINAKLAEVCKFMVEQSKKLV